MNLTRLLTVARKNLLEMFRDPVLLGFTLLTPAFFMLLNFLSYGTSPKVATYPIWVIQNTPKAERYVEKLKSERYADGRPAYVLTFTADRNAAEDALKDKRAAGLLIFGEDASGQVTIIQRGDALNLAFTRSGVQLEAALLPLVESAQGKPHLLEVTDRPLSMNRPINDFDTYAPGMMVFAILLLIPQTAMLVSRELRWGTLRRLQLTPLRPAELLGGISLAQMIMSMLLVVVMFAAALALGFHNRGSLPLALLVGLTMAFGSVGFGLVVACFVRSDTDALNTGSVVSMLQVFLSGAFFPMPAPTLFTLFGHQVGAFDFLPATHGMLALQQVLCSGANLERIVFRLAAALLCSVFYFVLGVWIFSHRQASLTESN